MKRQAPKKAMDLLVVALVCALPLSAFWINGTAALDSLSRGTLTLSAVFALPESGYSIAEDALSGESEHGLAPDTQPDTVQQPSTPSSVTPQAPTGPTESDIAQASEQIPEENRMPIRETQYDSHPSGDIFFNYGAGTIRNAIEETNTDMMSAASAPIAFGIELNSSNPQVLVVHTHSTESYDRFDAGFYDVTYPTRSTDINNNINAVGQELTDTLNSLGINTVHATEYHDYPSYNNSYSRSIVTIQKYLSMYPTIRIIIDVHRDGIQLEDGTRVKPTAMVGGQKAAQIMLVVGAGDSENDVPDFRSNLAFGARLQDSAETLFPGLTRPLYLAYRYYNQSLTPGSILIEVGSESSTLNEAKYSGHLVAFALAHVFGAYTPA